MQRSDNLDGMKLCGFPFLAIGAFSAAAVLLQAQPGAALKIDLSQPKAPVSPMLYGLMTEEINYSYDGGLYAELVRNRTFRSDWTGVLNWYVVEKGTAAAKLTVDSKTGPSSALTNSGKFEVTRADAANPALARPCPVPAKSPA